MQIFEAFVGISRALDNPLTPPGSTLKLCAQTGDHNDPSYFMRLNELFEMNIPVVSDRGVRKQYSWTPESIDVMFANREQVLPVLGQLKDNETYTKMKRIVHVRGKDKTVATPEKIIGNVIEYAHGFGGPIHILTDDYKISSRFAQALNLRNIPYKISHQSDIDDWYSILYANEVLGVLSSFTLSTLLINPDKNIKLFGRKHNDGPFKLSEANYEAAERIIHWCPNVSWI